MRTTVDINDELLRTAKQRAADEQATLRDVFDRALRQYLTQTSPKKFKLRWKAHKGGRRQPGVVLEDRSALFDLMDGRRRSHSIPTFLSMLHARKMPSTARQSNS